MGGKITWEHLRLGEKKKKSPQGSTNFYWTPDGAFGTGLG